MLTLITLLLANNQIPLKELVIFHHDQEYLDDVRSLESYILAELNVVNIRYTSDEESVGIKYRADADWPTLGKKLRKDVSKVRNALPKLGSDECKKFIADGKLDVNGIELVSGDLLITRFVEVEGEKDGSNDWETAADNDVIILLDIRKHADLESLALLRALTSRVNKLRKEAGLKPSDRVDVFYEYDAGVEEDEVREAIESGENASGNKDYVVEKIGGVPMSSTQMGEGRKVIQKEVRAKEADEMGAGERFVLVLVERV